MRTIFCIFYFTIAANIYGQDRQTLDSLSKVLEKIYYLDQIPRQQLAPLEKEFGYSSVEVNKQWELINKNDSVNTIIVSEIIDKYGWLGTDKISDTANRTLFLVIQHANIKTELKYIDNLRAAAETGRAKPSQYALLKDRTNLHLRKFQDFGSQLSTNKSGINVFYPIRDEPNVNKRRQNFGLKPLEEYATFFNVVYTLPKKDLYKNCFALTGYVRDTLDNPVENVSIYLGNKLMTKSDNDGYYIIPIKEKMKTIKILYRKKEFNDTEYIWTKEGNIEVYEKYVWLTEKKACP
jgi:hypothetical protein